MRENAISSHNICLNNTNQTTKHDTNLVITK